MSVRWPVRPRPGTYIGAAAGRYHDEKWSDWCATYMVTEQAGVQVTA